MSPQPYRKLLPHNRCEFFSPTIVRDTITLTIATVSDRGLPEVDLVEGIETVGLTALGAKHFAGSITSRRNGWIGTEPRGYIALNFRVNGMFEPQIRTFRMPQRPFSFTSSQG